MTPEPRGYQNKFIGEAQALFRDGATRVAMVAPTGSGKGFVTGCLAWSAMQRRKRTYVFVHRMELVDQIDRTLRSFDVRHGRIQPGWPESDWPCQIGMIQTAARRLGKYPEPDFIIIDECHHIVSATYQRVIAQWPNAKVVGFTATPLRLDGKGLGQFFDSMVIGPGTRELIDQGWLADFDYLAPPCRIDLSSVATRMGDYAIDQLAAAADKPHLVGDIVEHYKQYLDGRPAIAFAVRVDHAEHIAKQAKDSGIKAFSVDGEMPLKQRSAVIQGLATGETELLTSCSIVSEGLDIPAVSGAILARPTKSLALFLQMVGRTLRPKTDGSKAVILDHAGLIHSHGMPDAPRKWTLDDKKHREKPPPTKTCELCYRVFQTDAGWRLGAACEREFEPGCLLNVAEPEKAPGLTLPEVVNGALQQFTRTPDWAGGIDLLLASGPEYRAMMERADTWAKVDEIRKMRGYSPYWTKHVLRARREKAA